MQLKWKWARQRQKIDSANKMTSRSVEEAWEDKRKHGQMV